MNMNFLNDLCETNATRFRVWDTSLDTLDQCFLWTICDTVLNFFVAAICAYFYGTTTHLRRKTFTRTTKILLTLVFLNVVADISELLSSYILGRNLPGAYILSRGFSIVAWTSLFLFVFKTRRQSYHGCAAIIFLLFLLTFFRFCLQIHRTFVSVLSGSGHHFITVQCISNVSRFALNIFCVLISLRHVCQASQEESYAMFNENSIQSGEYELESSDVYLGRAEAGTNILTYLFFGWSNKLLQKGYCDQLKTTEDLFFVPTSVQIGVVQDQFDKNFNVEINLSQREKTQLMSTGVDVSVIKPRRIILRALHKSFGCFYYSLGLLKFTVDCLGFTGPILLNYLVDFVGDKQEKISRGYYIALGLFACKSLSFILSLQYDYQIKKTGMKFRTALVTSIYKKTLSTSKISLSNYSHGQIMNFMSTDTDCVVNFCQSFHEFWSLPFQIAVCLYLLYQQVGISFLSGVAFIILLMPINRWIAGKIGSISKDLMQRKDHRVKIVNELFHGIRSIKLHVWEKYFTQKITQVRNEELRYVKQRKYLDALCVYFWAATPVLISICTFATYIKLGGVLTASKVFTSIALFNMLISPLNAFPWVLNGLMESWVSLNRIETFIQEPHIQQYCKTIGSSSKNCVKLKKTSFTISKDEEMYLNDINLKIRKSCLTVVTGRVGSGKSLLMSAISGELNKKCGEVYISENDGIGYVSQEAWVQQGTIRENILFGKVYDANFYNKVIHACALTSDLEQMQSGDQSYVGESGIMLSGGQRARLSLARAVYQNKSIYLLDSPLAAVDSDVAAHIFQHCIMGLLKDKTRVLVTHNPRFMMQADHVVVMETGRLTKQGSPNEVLAHLPVQNEHHSAVEDIVAQKENDKEEERCNDELQKQGKLSVEVYLGYWYAVGSILALLVLLFLLLMQASKNVSDWWLSHWVSKVNTANAKNVTMYYLEIYTAIGAANTVMTFLRAFLFAYAGVKAAQTMHKDLLEKMVQKTFAFYDQTPIGRIINRFSSDVYTIDDGLPFIMNIFFANFCGLLGTLVITCCGIPWFSLIIPVLGFVYYNTQLYYRKTSRELKRLCSVTLSPIYEHFSETLTGLTTIRAMNQTERFTGENRMFLDSNLRANYSGMLASNWLALRLNGIGVAMVTFVSLIAVLQHQFSSVDPGLVGLALSYALSLTGQLNGLIVTFTETEKQLVCVERVLEYTQHEQKDEENNQKIDDRYFLNAGDEKLKNGDVTFQDVTLTYREGNVSALKKVSFQIKSGEKVGICGRTGAGKSSIFAAMFRTVELDQGSILIGGCAIENMSFASLRGRLAVIPQKPFLFAGPIRDNLDPFSLYSQEQLDDVLRKCCLYEQVYNKIGGLDGEIETGGNNFSEGQKQLLCLARALLQNCKVVCMDEATSNIDVETEQLIQQTLLNEFKDSTVFTIAHRLATIERCDRIFTMEDGRVTEKSNDVDQ